LNEGVVGSWRRREGADERYGGMKIEFCIVETRRFHHHATLFRHEIDSTLKHCDLEDVKIKIGSLQKHHDLKVKYVSVNASINRPETYLYRFGVE
jgi:hypothetical protein